MQGPGCWARCRSYFCPLHFAFCILPLFPAGAAKFPPAANGPNAPPSQRSTDPSAAAPASAPAGTANVLTRLLTKVPPPPAPEGPAAAPPPGNPMKIPLANGVRADRVEIQVTDGLISLKVREEPLNRVLMLLGQTKRLNIVCADSVNTPVSVTLERVPLDEALTSIVSVAGCSWTRQNGIIYVTNVAAAAKVSAEVQGRQMRVFRLDFASAADMDLAVKGMLSPVGKSFVTAAESTDNRKTQELVVVEDLPSYLRGIEQYVHQVNQPPRQVLIEAHILSVDLQHDNQLGINFQALIDQLGPLGGIQATGFADPTAAQAFFFTMNETHMKVLVQALTTQSNAKTLASPKVLVLNGQEAKIQIGDQLGFRVTTTTETSTLNNVSFLDVGVILKVTPRITADGQVLMQVHPEVSTGEINPLTQNPDSHTTMVGTSVMLPDGRGMVIGGLIQESDTDTQQKIPVLGDLWLIGRLFQRHEVSKERKEIVVALVPRVVPTPLACDDRHAVEALRAQTPLLQGPLDRVDRGWEPRLPDAVENPFHLRDLPVLQQRQQRICGPEGAEPVYAEPYYAGGQEPCPPPPRLYGNECPAPQPGPQIYPDRDVDPRTASRPPLPPPYLGRR